MHINSATGKPKIKYSKFDVYLFGKASFWRYHVFWPVLFFTKLTSLFRTFKSGDKDVTYLTNFRENLGNVVKV